MEINDDPQSGGRYAGERQSVARQRRGHPQTLALPGIALATTVNMVNMELPAFSSIGGKT